MPDRSKIEEICIFCKSYFFEAGCKGYSDLTPGYDAKEGCRKGYWETDMDSDTEADRRRDLLRATTCKDYCFFKEGKVG